MAVAALQPAFVVQVGFTGNARVEVAGHGVDQRFRGKRYRSGRFLVLGLEVKIKLWFLVAAEQAVLAL